jgi:hypothetical protein
VRNERSRGGYRQRSRLFEATAFSRASAFLGARRVAAPACFGRAGTALALADFADVFAEPGGFVGTSPAEAVLDTR